MFFVAMLLNTECVISDCNVIYLFLQDASEQKTELERLKQKIAEEVVKSEERKSKIDDELKEVQVSSNVPIKCEYFPFTYLPNSVFELKYHCGSILS